MIAKIKEYNPKIAVFNGKGIYEVFSGQKEFIFGKQPEKIEGTETVSRTAARRCTALYCTALYCRTVHSAVHCQRRTRT